MHSKLFLPPTSTTTPICVFVELVGTGRQDRSAVSDPTYESLPDRRLTMTETPKQRMYIACPVTATTQLLLHCNLSQKQ